MSNYLAFDLETALRQPHRVVTRDGRKVTEIFHAKTVKIDAAMVIAVIDGVSSSFYENGKYWLDVKKDIDLFLLPETREVWVNFYNSPRGLKNAAWHPTKEDADYHAGSDRIACVKVTIEMPHKKGGAEI